MFDTLYEYFRRGLGQSQIIQKYQKIKSSREIPKYSGIKKIQKDRQQKSIIFLCPSNNIPLGGVKVIYNQAAIINKMNGQLIASVLHPFNPEFSCTWFDHDVTVKKNLELDPTHHFVIIPEFMAVPHAKPIHDIGVQYGIYVQGGYIIGQIHSDNSEERDAAYHNAALILAISDDTVDCIRMAYPECADKVHRVHYSVNPDKFNANSNKENVICYMPRRMKNHSQLVTFFLNKWIPPHWRIESIHGLDEDGVAAILGKSRIFLSFSELEGCPLPPIEAALSGCQVIGYTGEGAKEYWDTEIFTEIYSGDIKAFVKAILSKIDEFDNSQTVIHTTAIRKLSEKYSAQVEFADMQLVTKKIAEILNFAD